jgi:hypothetical protein
VLSQPSRMKGFAPFFSPKGWGNIAQGNALGKRMKKTHGGGPPLAAEFELLLFTTASG